MAKIKDVILLAVALMVVAVIFPIALGLIGGAGSSPFSYMSYPYGNSTGVLVSGTLADVIDPSVITMLTILLPIIAIIAVVLFFLPKVKGSD